MADQIEELIREIAAKHGIAVSRDDPILVLQTINNRLLLESATSQRAQLEHFKEELEAVSMRWRTDAKEKADRALNAALSASKEAMRATILQSADATAERVRKEIDEAVFKLDIATSTTSRAAFCNLAASCITMFTVVIGVFSWFR